MFFLIQFIFYSLFFIFWLYSLLDRYVILSGSGEKLEKYIKNSKNITCNFTNVPKKIIFFQKDFNAKFNSPNWCKQKVYILFVSIDILILKISLSYNFLYSKVLLIKVFNKYIDLVTILQDRYIFFKIFYYIFFYIFILNIIMRLNSLYFKRVSNKNYVEAEKAGRCLSINVNDRMLKNINISEKGLYQNILITGSIGSGKTSCGISNILSGLLEMGFGGLVIDIKGNYIDQVRKIAKAAKREEDIIEISLSNSFKYNPINDETLSSLELANIIKRVLIVLSGGEVNSDPFWLDKSEEYIRDFITLIRCYKEFVSMDEIHNMVLSNDYLNERLNIIKSKVLSNKFTDNELFSINNAIMNIKNDYLNLDERTFGIIRAEITRMTSVFLSNANIYKKFCQKGERINFLSNKVYILNLDISSNYKLSKVIATYIKLQFQRQVLKNCSSKQTIFFLCDEYQEICNAEDASFFSLSREYKCINVISMQSYSSLINKLKDEYLSNVIIQNFINKIWFRNDDIYTVKKIISQIGKEKIYNETMTYGQNDRNPFYYFLSKRFVSYKNDFTKSYSKTETIQNKYNEEFFTQKLKTFEATCVLSDGFNIQLYDKLKFKRWEEDRYEV